MTFAELTWNPDNLAADGVTHMGWQAQYETDKGYILVVNAVLGEDALASATEAGQLYNCSTYSWDRDENSTPLSSEDGVDATRVEAIITEVEALTLPEVEETTTTTTEAPGPAPQWD
jgi:hypothetical protein